VRPYPMRTAGQPLQFAFDLRSKRFMFTFHGDDSLALPTEIFVPEYQYPDGYAVEVSDGTFEIDAANQLLRYSHATGREIHTVVVKPKT